MRNLRWMNFSIRFNCPVITRRLAWNSLQYGRSSALSNSMHNITQPGGLTICKSNDCLVLLGQSLFLWKFQRQGSWNTRVRPIPDSVSSGFSVLSQTVYRPCPCRQVVCNYIPQIQGFCEPILGLPAFRIAALSVPLIRGFKGLQQLVPTCDPCPTVNSGALINSRWRLHKILDSIPRFLVLIPKQWILPLMDRSISS